jgi:hypothetical protein
VVAGHAELGVRQHRLENFQTFLVVFGLLEKEKHVPASERLQLCKGSFLENLVEPNQRQGGLLSRVAVHLELEFVAVPVESLHDHQDRFQTALQALVVAYKRDPIRKIILPSEDKKVRRDR